MKPTDQGGQARDAVRRFRERVRLALFLGGVSDGLAATTIAFGGALVALRVAAGVAPAPTTWWLLAIVPSLVWGWLSARRRAPDEGECALHLDRRLGLEGLLLADLELGAEGWGSGLLTKLEGARAVMPRIRGQRMVGRVLPAAAFLAVVALLPPPVTGTAPAPGEALGAAVHDLTAELDRLARESALPETVQAELEDRLAELKDAMASNEPPTWADVDALEARVGHELVVREEARRQLLEALDAVGSESGSAGGGNGSDGGELAQVDPLTKEQLAALAQALAQAQALGLLDSVSSDLASALAALGVDKGAEGLDPSKLGLTPDQLKKLAENLRSALKDGKKVGELSKLAERFAKPFEFKKHERTKACEEGKCAICNGDEWAVAACEGGDCDAESCAACAGSRPGKGGVDRGRGDAGLEVSEGELPTTRPTGGVMPLERGAVPERGGNSLSVGRTEPETAPARDHSIGSTGTSDRDAAAAGRRKLAPRQRDVVRRFFGGADSPNDR